MRNTYHIEGILSKTVFPKNYPDNPKTFGKQLSKAGIDAKSRIYLSGKS